MSDNQEDDPVCTGCYGTGFNHYTERACTCEDGLKLKEEPPVVDDLIERTAALSAIRLGDTMTKLQSRIMALPAVDHPDNARLRAEVERLREALDGAYNERNRLVAFIARLLPSGLKKTAIEGWDEAWHGCVYIDLPTGQASWHYHDREAHLFDGLPPYSGEWDGHSTDEKYERIARAALTQPAPSPWRPIETAPKTQDESRFGPLIVLTSTHGHRAIGYWGERGGRWGWVNPNDHQIMDYWNAFTHWMPLPPAPKEVE